MNPRTWGTFARESFIALLSTAILVAPFGCQLDQLSSLLNNNNGSTLGTSSAGIFVNPDVSSSLLVAGRNTKGDAFFVYGKRTAAGGLDPSLVESILVKTADGKESRLTFDAGRPVYFLGPDGSSIKVTYQEIETNHFAVTITVYNAATQETRDFTGEVDLRAAASNVHQAAVAAAAGIKQAIGVDIPVPDDPGVATAKMQSRSIGALLSVLIVVPMVLIVYYAMIVTYELVAICVQAAVDTATQAVQIAITPLFDFASIFTSASFRVEIVPLYDLFLSIPPPPTHDF